MQSQAAKNKAGGVYELSAQKQRVGSFSPGARARCSDDRISREARTVLDEADRKSTVCCPRSRPPRDPHFGGSAEKHRLRIRTWPKINAASTHQIPDCSTSTTT